MAVITFANPTPSNAKDIFDGCQALTASDADTYERAVFVRVGGAGNLVCSPANGGADVTLAMVAGSVTPFRVVAVKATSTTATLLHAIF